MKDEFLVGGGKSGNSHPTYITKGSTIPFFFPSYGNGEIVPLWTVYDRVGLVVPLVVVTTHGN